MVKPHSARNSDLNKRTAIYFAVFTAAMNAFIGFVAFAFNADSGTYINYLLLASLILIAPGFYLFKDNFVFQLRLAFILAIGYFAALVKAIDSGALFSPVGFSSQTLSVAVQMFGLTSIAFFGALMGLIMFGPRYNGIKLSSYPGFLFDQRFATRFYVVNATIVIMVGYLSAKSYGPNIFQSAYASGDGEGQLLGNLQSIGVVSLSLCALASVQLARRSFFYLTCFLVIYLLGWGILIRGGRLEALSGILALIVLVPISKGKVFYLRPSYFVAGIFGALFLEVLGVIRSALADGSVSLEFIIDAYSRLFDQGIYHAGTISGIAITFANIIHMIDYSVINFSYGSTYFDYFLRTPPEFLYPSRPVDPSWMFGDLGYDAIGGFFELAEAYYNFGVVGCLVIPFIISAIIAGSYKRALSGRLFWLFIFAGLLSVFPRGAWYQSFAFYKSLFTGMFMFPLAYVCNIFTLHRSRII